MNFELPFSFIQNNGSSAMQKIRENDAKLRATCKQVAKLRTSNFSATPKYMTRILWVLNRRNN